MSTRREFLKKMVVAGGVMAFGGRFFGKVAFAGKQTDNPFCTLFRAVNGRPDENMTKVIELLGRIEKIVGREDIVIIKPNVQWWNQGAPNLAALKTFVELIMDRQGGFNGEVVIAENCHRGPEPWKLMSSGWAREFERNSDIHQINNYNDLCSHLKKKYGDKFSMCHWIRVSSGAKRVYGPSDGKGIRERGVTVNGYVYCDGTGRVPLITCDNGLTGSDYRGTIMTYPIFTTDRGTVVDFKNGIWEKGAYTEQPLRFVNFAALNHHSTYCGATSAVKNYLGISDLSGGADPFNKGKITKDYYNFHSFPFNKWSPGPAPGMLGKEIAVFMNTIRKADLNITTAEWVGLASRTDPPVARTRAVMACTDPVALDYHATKYVLYPNSGMVIHNPDDPRSPLHQYLVMCAREGGGTFDERHVAIKSYDFKSRGFQEDDNLVIVGEKKWGSDPKTVLKYFVLKYLKT